MGLYYSLGVIFDEKTQAESFLKDLSQQKIVLSDSTVVQAHGYLSETVFINVTEQKSVVQFFLDGLEIGSLSDKKLFSKPFFYEIRDSLYNFLLSTNYNFSHAFYELEGADKLLTDDLQSEILHDGIGEIDIGDKNAGRCSGKSPEYFYSKRLLDGLIVSDYKYPNVQIDFPEFREFKKGYSWLPIPNYIN